VPFQNGSEKDGFWTGSEKTMLARSRPDAMKAEIERHFPGEGAGFERFLKRESQRFKKLYPCLQKPYGTLAGLISPTLLAAVPHIAAGRSLDSVLADYFR
jgi:phytoene desaturase